ncbi:magnesium chelatase subunit D [Roseivivax sp. GX 12232]|uniref:magnesium chelatase subunit D n=1 Tax=Roseivivax sp. GX 12232 TaxID=2900547 RepID=UPI001E4B5A7F|nr:magnesium chelatase subunit D [Roseivivax sp. GX 12232]MCE0506272.1 magnesium chelatase subunit D [Roseivivax sp. GX 12232]
MKQDRTETWVAGHLALTLLAVDPRGLGGMHLRARASPVRRAFLDLAPEALQPFLRLPPTLDEAALFGGVDIAQSLAAGRIVLQQGLLSRPGTRCLTMAERLPRGRAAQLAQVLDAGSDEAVLLLDEGIEDEAAPEALTDRLAFRVDLDGVRALDIAELALAPDEIAAARARLSDVDCPDDALVALAVTAARAGVASLRAPLLALYAARAHAALNRRNRLENEDLTTAVALVLAPRATELPEEDESAEPPPEEQPPDDDSPPPEDSGDPMALPEDMLIEAMRAALPEGALQALQARNTAKTARGTGAGARKRGNRRGRPLPSQPGRPSSDTRLDLIATLRAAAPWQKSRRAAEPGRSGLILRREDFRVKVYEERSDRLVIFLVDASGSAAMARLAEAKGAVERLLGDAYASRDHVALVAFRGAGAQLLLPPTRSLVQAKRALGGLPGGGGTPLAAGLTAAADLAESGRAQGMTPALALLTDGRANIGFAGPGRAEAEADATRVAARIARLGLPGLVLDTNTRPKSALSDLARRMGAAYLPLPRADAGAISRSVADALGG